MQKFDTVVMVRCRKCDGYVKESDTEFENIEEDMQGRDVLTFICPQCKTTQKSLRYGGYWDET